MMWSKLLKIGKEKNNGKANIISWFKCHCWASFSKHWKKGLGFRSRILSYAYEFALPQDSKVKRFDAYDKEWLDFIVDSRKGKQPWSGYDIIEGGVADDRVIDAVEAYINGYADVEHTLRQLAYHKPNYQICILSQEIVDKYLQFKSYGRI